MNNMAELLKELDTVKARIASLEEALKDYPGYPSIAANLDSARRVKNRLEEQLKETAAHPGIELTNPQHVVPPGTPAK
jgi:hypothetical protein